MRPFEYLHRHIFDRCIHIEAMDSELNGMREYDARFGFENSQRKREKTEKEREREWHFRKQ